MTSYSCLFKVNNNKWVLLERPFASTNLNNQINGQYLSTMWFNHLIKGKDKSYEFIIIVTNGNRYIKTMELLDTINQIDIENISIVEECILYTKINIDDINDKIGIFYPKLIYSKFDTTHSLSIEQNMRNLCLFSITIQKNKEVEEETYSLTLPRFEYKDLLGFSSSSSSGVSSSASRAFV